MGSKGKLKYVHKTMLLRKFPQETQPTTINSEKEKMDRKERNKEK